ncbi:RNA-directed DNA polymerase, eukaryota, reverse transcriptase zinc-binding domain protein, partial [Tanacetum coccineum]
MCNVQIQLIFEEAIDNLSRKIRTWNIHISNDIESNDSDNEDISSNENVDPNKALGGFIQHVVEEKEVEKTPPKDPKADDSKPLGFKKGHIYNNDVVTSRGNEDVPFSTYQVKNNHTVTLKDMVADEVVSDNYKHPGFENFIKENTTYHIGRVILFGDLNEVRSESERFGSTFSSGDATIFNSFIHDTGLIDLPMGGRHFTWVNKVGSKMSKLDHFLISDDALHSNTDLKVVDLDRLWTTRINRMQELEDLEKLESMDLIQKSRVKWEVGGDENLKFFHGLINSRRKSQMVQGIMLDGVWNSEPKNIKSAFLEFYKDKFSCHDSLVPFPPMLPAHRLSIVDRDFLESMVSMDEIKAMIVAKILTNRLSKVIDSIISPEQSAFITGRKILDGPLILSETIGWYKKRKKKMMLFKADFEKAFDSVSWRGLRQGDPLSPFLFIIVMEDLHMALNDGLAANMFHGVKVGSP